MMRYPIAPLPTLAQRAWELRALPLDGARLVFFAGRALHYRFRLAPSEFGRIYTCELRLTPDARPPEMFVLDPDLKTLTDEEALPHIYPSKGLNEAATRRGRPPGPHELFCMTAPSR